MSPTEAQMKVAELQMMLHSKHPQMPRLLRDIHTTLKSDPETVTLLTDAEVGTIVAGLQQFTGNFITAKAAAPSKSGAISKKALAGMSADDL